MKQSNFGILAMAILLTLTYSCSKNTGEIIDGAFTDSRDDINYKVVTIGEQIWMAENLAYEAEGSLAYENSEDNAEKYGRLYSFEIAQEVCPSGWHLPTNDEWMELSFFVQGSDQYNSSVGERLKATEGWDDNGNGTDMYGFSALPGGSSVTSTNYHDIGRSAYWWTSTSEGDDRASGISLIHTSGYISTFTNVTSNGYSVRCVKDQETNLDN